MFYSRVAENLSKYTQHLFKDFICVSEYLFGNKMCNCYVSEEYLRTHTADFCVRMFVSEYLFKNLAFVYF